MVVTFMITVRLSMPVVLVALAVVAIVGGSLQVVIFVLGLLLWDRYAVVMRSSTLQIRSMDYVTAAQAAGSSVSRIIFSEMMTNVVNNLIVVATLEIAHAIILEAALSFLGLGVQPPLADWGSMVRDNATLITYGDFTPLLPAGAIAILTIAVNFVVDWFLHKTTGLRDEQ